MSIEGWWMVQTIVLPVFTCMGTYLWALQAENVHRAPGQCSMPLPCKFA